MHKTKQKKSRKRKNGGRVNDWKESGSTEKKNRNKEIKKQVTGNPC